jgi:ATP-dependent RNA helicase RhlE
MNFKELGIIDPILIALNEKGYTKATPIQEQSIPILLKGKDLLGCAQTGTGKTASFAIPIIQQMVEKDDYGIGKRRVKALIVTPTRELALQIGDNFSEYSKNTKLKKVVIFGGVKQSAQTATLRQGVDIVIATPGRLLDLISQRFITLRDIEYFVLDEADQMLDMGFIHDIKKIIALLPTKRQSLFFSATMPPAIAELSSQILGDYERVTIKPEQATAEKVEQAIYYTNKKDKNDLLIHLLKTEDLGSTLVFSRTKHGSDKIVKKLVSAGITAAAIHGNKSQPQREKALGGFKDGKIDVLVATDIAARGIDVEDLPYVINYDLPNVSETYVHRIGRTGRASASGIAWSFCDHEERGYLKDIEKLIRQRIPVKENHPYPLDESFTPPPKAKQGGGNRGRQNPREGGNSSNSNKRKPSNNRNRR